MLHRRHCTLVLVSVLGYKCTTYVPSCCLYYILLRVLRRVNRCTTVVPRYSQCVQSLPCLPLLFGYESRRNSFDERAYIVSSLYVAQMPQDHEPFVGDLRNDDDCELLLKRAPHTAAEVQGRLALLLRQRRRSSNTTTLSCINSALPPSRPSRCKTLLTLGGKPRSQGSTMRNLLPEVGLVDGIRGEVVDFVSPEGVAEPALPDFVLKISGYSGPEWSTNPDYMAACPLLRRGHRGHRLALMTPLMKSRESSCRSCCAGLFL